jgi:type I restriction enzyme S subunit
MNRYDSYKDSGVEWIGEIPSHWGIKRFSYSFDIQKGKLPKELLDESSNTYLPYLSMDVLRGGEPSNFTFENDGVKVEKGDIGLLWDGSNSGEIIQINQKGILSSTVSLISIKDQKIREDFSYFLLKFYESDFKNNTVGMGIPHVNGNHVRESKILLPPLSEQQQIVSFLDTKTSLIDSLIEKTQRKIELLKENRTSLINEVVTKGLNPNVEMKDSGVEWIGEIPSHWELRKGSTIGNYSKGNGIKKDEVRETGLPCIRYGEIYTKYNHKFERVKTFIDEGITDVKVSSGTLFMTGSGELLEEIGKCVVYVGKEELYVGGDIIILKPFSEFDSEFLSYQINSECIRIQRELNGRGGIIVHIYSKNFKDMWFPTPSLSEQNQIVSYLDEHTQLIDKTISVEERRIELLKEYRQSLISEVVTGKRKVVTYE